MFDRLAEQVARQTARAWFFTACVTLVAVWVPTLWLLPVDTSQLIINTATTIVTFLLVALLQNTQDRAAKAQSHKMDALMEGVAVLLDDLPGNGGREKCIRELRRMAGVELEASS